MIVQTFQSGEIQIMGNFVHTEEPDRPLHQGSSSLDLNYNATTVYDTSNNDESDDDVEALRRTRAHYNSDRLPPAWCREAERESPEPEEPLNARSNPSTQVRRAVHDAGLPGHAYSAARSSIQQDSSCKLDSLSDIVCVLELGRNAVRGEVVYRKKVLDSQIVDQAELCEMMDKRCTYMVFYDDSTVSSELLGLVRRRTAVFTAYFEVVVATEWSDWMSMEGYKADRASYDFYQMMLEKEGSF